MLQLVSVVYRQMDRLIIGIVIGTAAVSRYEIAYKIQAMSALALAIVPSALMPAAAQLEATDNRERLDDLYLHGTRYAVGFCLPIAVAVIALAGPLINTWISPRIPTWRYRLSSSSVGPCLPCSTSSARRCWLAPGRFGRW